MNLQDSCHGEYKFPFQFQLPPDVPSSFEDYSGSIQYCEDLH